MKIVDIKKSKLNLSMGDMAELITPEGFPSVLLGKVVQLDGIFNFLVTNLRPAIVTDNNAKTYVVEGYWLHEDQE